MVCRANSFSIPERNKRGAASWLSQFFHFFIGILRPGPLYLSLIYLLRLQLHTLQDEIKQFSKTAVLRPNLFFQQTLKKQKE